MLWGDSKSAETIQKRALDWMKEINGPIRHATPAYEAIAWAQEMPRLEKILEPEVWSTLGEFLSRLPAGVDQLTLEDQPLLHQLLAAELALTLATRLPQAPFSARLAKTGRAAIALGLGRTLDRQGMLPAREFGCLRYLLACWTSCRAMAAELPSGGWDPPVEKRYQRFVRNVLRCTRPDGDQTFAEDYLWGWTPWGRNLWGRKLFESVLEGGVEEIDRHLVAVSLPNLSPGFVAKPSKKAAGLPPASIHCEERAVAVMRRDWNRNDERVAVLFPGRTCSIELAASGRVAVSGAWKFEIAQQGRQLQPVSNWESTCWYTDEDVDYLELEIELTAGVKLQRQIVLAREDRFLFLADAVMGPQRGRLEYRSVLPLAAEVQFRGAEEGREGILMHGRVATAEGKPLNERPLVQHRAACTGGTSAIAFRPLAQVLPLGMPEWRAEQHDGELKMVPEGLELRQTTAGQRLFAPLFIDLDRGRFRRRMTWRRLTVGERLAPVPPDVAVGFRVAIGKEQWIIYRALAARDNRTLLGHNLATESLIARFGKDGEVTSIVEIE